jgi:chromosomal replication initiator protein
MGRDLAAQIADLRARVIVLEGRAPPPLTLPPGEGLGRIIAACAAEFGTAAEEVIGEGRHAAAIQARHAAMAIGRRLLGYSLPRIGRVMRRDHTTVLAAIRGVERRAAEDPDYAARLDALVARIRQQMEERA